MKNFDYCVYTYRHRKAIEYLTFKLIKDPETFQEMMRRAKVHDMDKMVMYQFLEKKEASSLHRQTATHHMGNGFEKSYYDKLEAILDYESAGYTKPDKPLNAYDTLLMFKENNLLDDEIIEDLLKITNELGIDHSYSVTDDKEGMEYLSKFENVTEEMIKNELIEYVTK